MAEEVEYSSRPDHKLKYYEDQAPPPPSSSVSTAPFVSQSSSSSDLTPQPPSSPPVIEMQLAKPKSQEINNGGGGGGTDDSNDFTQKQPLGQQQIPSCSTTTTQVAGSTKEIIHVPNGMLCVIMGRAGETIKSLQAESGAKIQVTKDIDCDPNSASRAIELVGTPDQISKAKKLIMDDLVAVNQTMSNYYSLDELMESK